MPSCRGSRPAPNSTGAPSRSIRTTTPGPAGDEAHLQYPFYGSRRLSDWLGEREGKVNRKRVQRLMLRMGLEALYPRPRTSRPGKGRQIYPYLFRDLTVERPNRVWAADICYLPMARGFLYLVAMMDWYSRHR